MTDRKCGFATRFFLFYDTTAKTSTLHICMCFGDSPHFTRPLLRKPGISLLIQYYVTRAHTIQRKTCIARCRAPEMTCELKKKTEERRKNGEKTSKKGLRSFVAFPFDKSYVPVDRSKDERKRTPECALLGIAST